MLGIQAPILHQFSGRGSRILLLLAIYTSLLLFRLSSLHLKNGSHRTSVWFVTSPGLSCPAYGDHFNSYSCRPMLHSISIYSGTPPSSYDTKDLTVVPDRVNLSDGSAAKATSEGKIRVRKDSFSIFIGWTVPGA